MANAAFIDGFLLSYYSWQSSRIPAERAQPLADVVDANTRSRMMAGIRGKNTTPEVRLRKALHRAGFRFRLHCTKLPGKPDIVLAKHRAAIFVHGCFWHRHAGCRNSSVPKSNTEFWKVKFARNVERDKANLKALIGSEWRVCIVWECAIRQRGEKFVAEEVAEWTASSLEIVKVIPAQPSAT
jgi:DNA mismatch endonuclease (patch repair protein)